MLIEHFGQRLRVMTGAVIVFARPRQARRGLSGVPTVATPEQLSLTRCSRGRDSSFEPSLLVARQ